MKAIIVNKPEDIQIIDVEKPIITNEDEVIIKIMATGVCGSDVGILFGHNPVAVYPRIIGHEMTGIIVEKGKNVKNFELDDHVIVKQTESCGKCYACTHNQENVCSTLKVRGVTIDGGYQQYYKVNYKSIYKIDKNVDLMTAVLIEPYTIGFQACSRGNLQSDDILLVNGVGALGAIVVDVAKSFGCKIIAIDIDKDKLNAAKELGATYTLLGNDNHLKEKILELTDNYGPTISIDCVCNPKSVEFVVDITGNGGRVVTMGFDKRPSHIPQYEITVKQLSIIGSRLQHNQFEKVIKLFEDNKVNPSRMVSHVFKYTDIDKVYELIKSKNYKKILLDFSD
ncbi:MAG: zinc-binding dehydrogenase [Pleomorphochaeta sp.]